MTSYLTALARIIGPELPLCAAKNDAVEFELQDFGGIGGAALKTIGTATSWWDRWIVHVSYGTTANQTIKRRLELSIWFACHGRTDALESWDAQSVHCIPKLRDITNETRWTKTIDALRDRVWMYWTRMRLEFASNALKRQTRMRSDPPA